MMETSTQDVLASDYENQLIQASVGKRFANYIIDLIVFYLLVIMLGVIIALISPAAVDSLDYEESNIGASLLDRFLALILFGVYMSVVETLFKGRSIGKMITGTKAVNLDGSQISAKTAFLRGFSRIVPFEPFSAFGGNPWHDKWTDTMVIDIKESNRGY